MKNLYFIRHGQSNANASGIWSGQLDSPLSDQGLQEAKQAGEQAAKDHFNPTIILSSPLVRAAETARTIANSIGYPQNKIVYMDQLKERSFGKLEGTDIAKTLPDFNDYKKLDTIETVEKLEDLQARVKMVLEEIKKMPEETVLIVGHAAFGRALRREINGLPYTAEYEGEFKQIPNAQIIKLL